LVEPHKHWVTGDNETQPPILWPLREERQVSERPSLLLGQDPIGFSPRSAEAVLFAYSPARPAEYPCTRPPI